MVNNNSEIYYNAILAFSAVILYLLLGINISSLKNISKKYTIFFINEK